MILMLAPGPNMAFGSMPSGATYVSDQNALIRIGNDSAADQVALQGVGCFTLSPFGGWGSFGFATLANLYSADTASNLVLPGVTGFPRFTIATVFSDATSASDGTWLKTGTGNGSGAWTQVSTLTLAAVLAAVAALTTLVQALAQSLGAGDIYASYSAAAAAASGLANGTLVQVISDTTHGGDRTLYVVQSGALVFQLDFSPGGMSSSQLTALFNALQSNGNFAQFLGT